METKDIRDILLSSRIFSSLGTDADARLIGKFTQVELAQGRILFYQGDPSESVYVLVAGKLSAEVTESTGESRILGHIDPGETVGELGALSSEPRSLTIRALKDSHLLRLKTEDFLDICHHYPAVMFAALQPIITRSKSIIQMISAAKNIRHIVVVPASKQVSLQNFFEKIAVHSEDFRRMTLFSDYQPEFRDPNMSLAGVNEMISRMVKSRKASHRHIYILRSFDSPLAKACLSKADKIYIAAFGDSHPEIDSHVLDKITSRRLHLRADPVLLLLHHKNTDQPSNTSAWFALADFSFHHHVRLDKTNDIQRLLRFMRGKAVGVVLSGGGTRGWAHLGAIRAIRESKIPIDIIGGTSAGAVVAACYAMNQSYDEMHEKFYNIVFSSRKSIALRSLTWPVISLFNAKKFTQAQQEAFGQKMIEDMWLAFFCVSCNLSNNSEAIHRTGMLWETIRASTSLPGIIPPMLLNGDIHLDGGLLNNLPVDVMREYIGHKGKVIAVDLNSFAPHAEKYRFPPVLTFTEAFLSRFGLGKSKYKYPSFIDTFLRGIFVGSLAKGKQNALAANVFVNLDLSRFKLLHSNPEEAGKLIEIGYTETMRQLHTHKNKSG